MAREWNKHRTDGYPADTFDQLAMRFEEPDSSRRWEHPLFTVLADDVDPPYDAIWNAVVHGKAAPPNMATVVVSPSTVCEWWIETCQGSRLSVSAGQHDQGDYGCRHAGATGWPRPLQTSWNRSHLNVCTLSVNGMVRLPDKSVTLSQLTRLRRQFLNMNKLRGQLQDMDTATVAFVDYLNTSMQAL
jgi:protein KTI12